ncbi:uncharacterized protein EI90DRAFT_3013778 [Cantharellus anzutake]|uniref:uncharacterized protein n=1 Tax=Cantharellus anzutake TaxID=1750568 RepID=UPI001904F2EB|nr:uncharacterized protein EI90DRAFT_3013778 [Cantharellus anzutake]KAF8337595.1 hypothetical protein EI90DRAFT_3013778 [Cantharellus anzutake]
MSEKGSVTKSTQDNGVMTQSPQEENQASAGILPDPASSPARRKFAIANVREFLDEEVYTDLVYIPLFFYYFMTVSAKSQTFRLFPRSRKWLVLSTLAQLGLTLAASLVVHYSGQSEFAGESSWTNALGYATLARVPTLALESEVNLLRWYHLFHH